MIHLRAWRTGRIGSSIATRSCIRPRSSSPRISPRKENVARYGWAQAYLEQLVASADGYLPKLSDAYVEQMIETTTPGCTGPCPACRAKGLAWHPNGLWSWSPARPEQLECSACQTVFPNESFPETVEVNSSWGRGQKITFIGGETFVCFGYRQARPSISSIIRTRKVAHMTNIAETLALAHALTDDPRYARGVRLILLRLADVFPEYLVRAGYGYGETAGMDPHVAARQINNLPEDELVYPPNKPDRKIHTGYWSATRIGTSGMDGGWVVSIALAYDLTCSAQADGAPIYSADERKRVERDLLLESTYLALCDPAINNKSVGNRAGAAVVGMCVGHPGLVHFGLEGFRRCVDEWFLPDGGTSESPAYAMMTMNGIAPFALALRDYSDPPGYAPSGRAAAGPFQRLPRHAVWRLLAGSDLDPAGRSAFSAICGFVSFDANQRHFRRIAGRRLSHRAAPGAVEGNGRGRSVAGPVARFLAAACAGTGRA